MSFVRIAKLSLGVSACTLVLGNYLHAQNQPSTATTQDKTALATGVAQNARSATQGQTGASAQAAQNPTGTSEAQNEAGTSQDQSATTLQQVVVSSTRASLQSALSVKRNSLEIVDAISAEGLGKFPDTNVADALQRIPGVSIDRDSFGDGQFVTVRGLGPTFNNVLVNGRSVTSENADQEFSFDLYPSDIISTAEVYKTGNPDLQAGGIGATINLKTVRPLDLSGLKIVLDGSAYRQDNAGETEPQMFAMFGDNFMDDTLGVLVSLSDQKQLGYEDELTGGWTQFDPATNILPGTLASGNPDLTHGVYPVAFQRDRSFFRQERQNAIVTLQYKPRDNLTFTVDGMYDYFQLDQSTTLANQLATIGNLSDIVMNSNGVVQSFNANDNSTFEILVRESDRPVTTENFGFNVNWQTTDHLSNVFDYAHSSSVGIPGPTSGQGDVGLRVASSSNYADFWPEQTLDISQAELGNPANYLSHVAQWGAPASGATTTNGDDVHDTLDELKWDGTYTPSDWGPLAGINYGVAYSTEAKSVSVQETNPDIYCLFCGFLAPIPAGLLQSFNSSGFMSGAPGSYQAPPFTFSIGQLISYYESAGAQALRDSILGLPAGSTGAEYAQYGGTFGLQTDPTSFVVNQATRAFYISTTWSGNALQGWTAELGFRGEETHTTAQGYQTVLLDLTPLSGSEISQYNIVTAPQQSGLITESHNYFSPLPSLNVKWNLARNAFLADDELTLRGGVSKTITRPLLTNIAPSLAFGTPRPEDLTATSGNTNLKPYSSLNFDLALDYYFGGLGYVSVAPFYKKISDFIVSYTSPEVFHIANSGNIANDTDINGQNATFLVTYPSNSEAANIKGLELAGQMGFNFLPNPFDGLGMSANATFLKSNAEFNSYNWGNNFAIPGLSNTYNATLFYSKGPLDVRVAYSYRAKYLLSVSIEPTFQNPYAETDFHISYTLPGPGDSTYSVYVGGVNIFNQKLIQVGRFSDELVGWSDPGPRYMAGIRLTF
jgi:TonB-dependent receptor